jgi:hypothetical protein
VVRGGAELWEWREWGSCKVEGRGREIMKLVRRMIQGDGQVQVWGGWYLLKR